MDLRYNYTLLSLLFGLLSMTTSLSADAGYISQHFPLPQERKSYLRSRPLAQEKREAIRQMRAIEREEEDQYDKQFSHPGPHSNPSLCSISPLIAALSQIAPHASNSHWVTAISDTNRTIEIEDGSYWEVVEEDRYILNHWKREDQLIITPNYNWFLSGDYYITNKNNNTYVRVELCAEPVPFGPYSHWIVAIDRMSGHITLENGATWCIYSKDNSIFGEWEINDHVIIGVYDNWLHPFNHILINVNMDTHVRAKQY